MEKQTDGLSDGHTVKEMDRRTSWSVLPSIYHWLHFEQSLCHKLCKHQPIVIVVVCSIFHVVNYSSGFFPSMMVTMKVVRKKCSEWSFYYPLYRYQWCYWHFVVTVVFIDVVNFVVTVIVVGVVVINVVVFITVREKSANTSEKERESENKW